MHHINIFHLSRQRKRVGNFDHFSRKLYSDPTCCTFSPSGSCISYTILNTYYTRQQKSYVVLVQQMSASVFASAVLAKIISHVFRITHRQLHLNFPRGLFIKLILSYLFCLLTAQINWLSRVQGTGVLQTMNWAVILFATSTTFTRWIIKNINELLK